MADVAEGLQEEQKYRQFGATDDQINEWKTQQIATFRKANASDQQINDYFGVKDPDTSAMKAYVKDNIAKFDESRKAADGTPQKEAASFGEYFNAGWENSVSGLIKEGHEPSTVLPENAGFAARMLQNAGQIAGDLPAMVAGGFGGSMVGAAAGGAVGTAVFPGVGTLGGIAAGSVVGGGAGAFAAPAGMRKLLMDYYEKGDIHTPGDFMERLSGVTMETLKGAAVGALTSGAGMLAKPVAGVGGALLAELGTMTTAGAAMQGRLPDAQEFVDGAILLGGMHLATGGVPTKLREIYAKTGERPEEIVQAANENPAIKQDLLSENDNLPPQAAKAEEPPETSKGTAEPNEDQKDLDAKLGGNEPTQKDITGKGSDGGTPPPPREPGEEKSPEEVNSAVKEVLGKIGKHEEPDEPAWYSKQGRANIMRNVYENTVDRYTWFGEAKGVASDLKLKPSEDPALLAAAAPGFKAKFETFMKTGTLDYATGKRNGEGMEQIFKGLSKDESNELMAYAISRRAEEQMAPVDTAGELKETKKTGINPDTAKTVIDALGDKYKDRAERLFSFNNRVMQYAVDAGLLPKENQERILQKNGSFIPLWRAQEVDDFSGEVKGSGSLYPESQGSEKDILHPYESMATQTMRVIKSADMNRVGQAFGDMIKNSENGKALGKFIDKPTGADNEVSYMENGEKKTFATEPEYARAFQSLNYDPEKTALWMKMLQGPASLLRSGTVLAPDFIARHGMRSFDVMMVQSKSLGNLFTSPLDLGRAVIGNFSAMGDIWKENKSYQEFMASGGASSTLKGLSDYMGKQGIFDINEKEGFFSRVWNAGLHPLEYAAHLSDTASRLAEFKRLGGVDGDLETKLSAGDAARNVTLDYNRAGAYTKQLSSFIPFMNIGIQGMDRMARGWNEDKVGFTARAAAALTVPTLLNWAYNRNDSRYQDAPAWEKDLYWIIPQNKWEPAVNPADAISRPPDLRRQAADGSWEVNNGTTLRIAKPFELGLLFASGPERILNAFADHDPHAADSFMRTLLHGALPNVLPTALTPILEQSANKNYFTGRPIISSHAEGLLPEYQYNEYTSTVAKQLGRVIGFVPGLRDIGPKDAKLASPMVIDNYIHDWSGTMGQYALQLADKAAKGVGLVPQGTDNPAHVLADIPVITAFVARNPSQNLQPIQDFYTDYEKAIRITTTVKDLMKPGPHASIQQAMQLQKDNVGDMTRLTSIHEALGAQSKFLQMVNSSPDYSPTDKRQLMDSTYYQMSMIAKQGNQIIDARRKSLNAQQ